jgi:hypothetical protein
VNGKNAAGIVGDWYIFEDQPDCVRAGFSADQCSVIHTPDDAFTPSDLATGRMCTWGVAAQILNLSGTTMPAYSAIWGAGIGLAFNNFNPYDAGAHGITGISFEIDTPPELALTVSFPVSYTSNYPAWEGAVSGFSPVYPGVNVVKWADVGGPMYAANPPPFDPSQLEGMQFQVLPSVLQPTPFAFCLSNLTALTD